MKNVKPAASNGGHREIIIADWRPHEKGSLKGFFRATLPSGLTLNGLMLHERDGARWLGLPAREWTDQQGEKQYAKIIEFIDRPTANKFRDAVLDALDRHLAGAVK